MFTKNKHKEEGHSQKNMYQYMLNNGYGVYKNNLELQVKGFYPKGENIKKTKNGNKKFTPACALLPIVK